MNTERLESWLARGSAAVIQQWLPTWSRNALANKQAGAFREDRALYGLRDLFADVRRPCVLAGPGPSLDQAIPHLQANPYNVIAVNSALNPLLANDIQPIITVCIHPEEEQAEQVREVASRLADDAILVCPITIHPGVVEAWPGQICFFRTRDPNPSFAAVDIIMDAVLEGLDLGSMTPGGCVASAALFIAFYAGFRDIRVLGYEMGAEPGDLYYGARYDLSNGTARRRDDGTSRGRDAEEYFERWMQNNRYRMAFEQRVEFFAGLDDGFRAVNLSPFSFLQLPRADMAESLAPAESEAALCP